MAVDYSTQLFYFYPQYIWRSADFTNFQTWIYDTIANLTQGAYGTSVLSGLQCSINGGASGLIISVQPGIAVNTNTTGSSVLTLQNVANVTLASPAGNPANSLIVLRPNATNQNFVTSPSNPSTTVPLNSLLGASVVVLNGTPAGSPAYPATTPGDVVLMGLQLTNGQTTITYTNFDFTQRTDLTLPGLKGPESISNMAVSYAASANAATFNITDPSGNALSPTNPGRINMRSATATNGGFLTRTTVSPVSVTIPSTATLGLSSGVASKIYVYAIDNAGAIEIAVAGEGYSLPENGIVSTTAASAGSTSNSVLYSASARSSIAARLLAVLDVSVATAGTWLTGSLTAINPNGMRLPMTTNSIIGVVDGGTLAAGRVGENYTDQAGPINAASSNTNTNVSSRLLQPGTWEISSNGVISANGATITAAASSNMYISTVSAQASGAPADAVLAQNQTSAEPPTANYNAGLTIAGYIVKPTVATTYYTKISTSYSAGTPQFTASTTFKRIA